MPDRRGLRFLLEALFLAGLAAALAVARLRSLEIAGVMLLGWLLVAVLEWAAWRGGPHYGSGLPPRYYVPRLNVPPARPTQAQVWSGFPAPKPAPRREAAVEWPLAAGGSPAARREVAEADPWLVASLPVAPIERDASRREPVEPQIDVASWATVAAARAGHAPKALHALDPLAEEPKRRRKGGDEEPPRVEVPARPPGVRSLPSRWNG